MQTNTEFREDSYFGLTQLPAAGGNTVSDFIDRIENDPQRFWTEYADLYDTLLRLDAYREMIARVCEEVEPQAGQTISDIGCGTGNGLRSIWHKEPGAILYGVDRSPRMLTIAQEKLSKVAPHFTLEEGDIDKNPATLRIPESDAIISTNVLYAVQNRQELIRVLANQLKTGGKMVVTNPLKSAKLSAILRVQRGAGQLKGIDWETTETSELNRIITALFPPEIATKFRTVTAMNQAILAVAASASTGMQMATPAELMDDMSDAGLVITKRAPTYANVNVQITAVKQARRKERKETQRLEIPTTARLATPEELPGLRKRVLEEYQRELKQPDRTFELEPDQVLVLENQENGDIMACMGLHRPNKKHPYYPAAEHFGVEAMEATVPGLDLQSGSTPELMRFATFEPYKRTHVLGALTMICSFALAQEQGAKHLIGTNKEQLYHYIHSGLGIPIQALNLPPVERDDVDRSKIWENYWQEDDKGKVVPVVLPLDDTTNQKIQKCLEKLDPNKKLHVAF